MTPGTKRIMTYVIILATVVIGMTFVMSDSASAQVLPSGAVIVRPAFNQPFVAPRPIIFQQPFARPAFNPFANPFVFNPFLFNRPSSTRSSSMMTSGSLDLKRSRSSGGLNVRMIERPRTTQAAMGEGQDDRS